VVVGEGVSLTCTVLQGNPMNFAYTWTYNGNTITPTSSGSYKSVLNLTSTEEEDIGVYFCSVSNGIQPDGADNFALTRAGNLKIY